jgi:hypothetical protein
MEIELYLHDLLVKFGNAINLLQFYGGYEAAMVLLKTLCKATHEMFQVWLA